MPIINNPYIIGQSSVDTQNFRLQSGNDGTLTLARKSDGSGGDILTVASDGKVSLPQGETITQSKLQSGTAVASTSGTSIDFTGIPSWAKRITVMLNGVSTNGTSTLAIRIGAATTPETTGYSSSGYFIGAATVSCSTSSTHFLIGNSLVAARSVTGQVILNLMTASNLWTYSGTACEDGFSNAYGGVGAKSLAAPLGVLRITTVNGTDTFDAGSINIMWE